jgi:hypothetical protein
LAYNKEIFVKELAKPSHRKIDFRIFLRLKKDKKNVTL